jgi:hypothetical protein
MTVFGSSSRGGKSLCASGTPGQAWLILVTEKSHPCKLLVQHVVAAPVKGNRKREVGRSLDLIERGERRRFLPDNKGISPSESESDSASLHLNGSGQPSRDGEACNQQGRNERRHLLGCPG